MVWIILILLVFISQIATIMIAEHRNPYKALAWLLILFAVPVLGFIVYYFLARGYKQRRTIRKRGVFHGNPNHPFVKMARRVHDVSELDNPPLMRKKRLFRFLQHVPESLITCCNETTVLTNAEPTYKEILQALESASEYIHMEYYTIRNDETGMKFLRLLMEKARLGVKVKLIYDGIGSYDLEEKCVQELKQAGVECHCFLPPLIAFFDKRANYRNHRKIVVVDGRVGYVGGINIGDEHLGLDPKLGFWRDTHLKLVGDAVYHLQHIFLTDWHFVSGQSLQDDPTFFPAHECQGNEKVQMISSGPDTQHNPILEMVFTAINHAQKKLYISTPYFIPDRSLMVALKNAADSGVDVRIILPGVTDSIFVYWGSLSYIQELLQVGVRFYRYQKGFIHAKIIIVDDMLASVGTANMDMRSFFSNFELLVQLYDSHNIERLEQDFMLDLEISKEMKEEHFNNQSWLEKVRISICRMLSPLL